MRPWFHVVTVSLYAAQNWLFLWYLTKIEKSATDDFGVVGMDFIEVADIEDSELIDDDDDDDDFEFEDFD